jgi:hypothetical protein
MNQRKRRLDWPAIFFSNPDEKILEIGYHPDLTSPLFRCIYLHTNPFQSRDKESFLREKDNIISIRGRADLLPFPDRSFDGVIILELPEQDSESTVRMLSEVKRVLKYKGQCLIFLKNNSFSLLRIYNPLNKFLNILYLLGFSCTEIYWPYRSLRNVKRLIPLGSPTVERHLIRDMTILHSDGNFPVCLQYLGMLILSFLNVFGKIIPQGYLISARS